MIYQKHYFSHKLYYQLLFFSTLFFLISSCNPNSKKNEYSEVTPTKTHFTDGYVGDQNCNSCHTTEYNLWKKSHHDLAMQIADKSTVLGNFNNVTTEIDGILYHFFQKNKDYFVTIKELDGSEKEYKIAYTFGFTPLQQYLVDFDNGSKQVLRVTWNTVNKKWYHQYKGDRIKQHDWLHWSKGAQNWNTMCAECHSTNLKKNYAVDTDSYNTTYSSINVSCESCHGPGEKHLDWAKAKSKNKNAHILIGKNQQEQLDVCAACHARRSNLTKNYVPGKKFEDQYMLQNLTSNFYHGDGQIKEEDYVYGSFLQSKMYAEGVKCNDCHNVHSLKLKKEGNQLCLQCHVPAKYETKKHYFHKENTEASLCVNCHMTGTNYMGNDFRRDHSFRIPRPDQSVKYGTPNACTGCHKGKSNKWAAKVIKDKFGNKRAPHFSDALLLSSKNNLTEAELDTLNNFINNLKYPAIARATVIENTAIINNKQYEALLISLKDSSAKVRYNALLKMRNIAPEQRIAVALKHITDSVKLVRIAAAQMTIGLDKNSLNEIEKDHFKNAVTELETMLFSSADFSIGRVQLGNYYLQKNDINKAITHYEKALGKDSLLIIAYPNLATAYNLNGNIAKAQKTLNTWITLEPNSDRPHYLKALLFFEQKQDAKAIKELKKTIDLNSKNTRAMYNLAVYYFQDKKNVSLAKKYIKDAVKIDPKNQDYNYLLDLIYKSTGKQ